MHLGSSLRVCTCGLAMSKGHSRVLLLTMLSHGLSAMGSTVTTGHGMAAGSEFWHHTHTHGTCDQNTTGKPTPMLFPSYLSELKCTLTLIL